MNTRTDYERDGYVLIRGLFSADEAAALRDHYTALNEVEQPFSEGGVQPNHEDPLRRFPRMMQPHLGDHAAMDYLLDPRIGAVFGEILGDLPYGVQTMVYFKPPGARGQALHQDQRYLCVHPGTCVAAWMALDRCDAENGCLDVVPGSHRFPVLCPTKADTSVSFTSETVPVPDGMAVVQVEMEPGDVLFFHGNLIHGSGPNASSERFRRIIVGHYVLADTETVSRWYNPAFRFDGTQLEIPANDLGNICGEFVGQDVVMSGTVEEALARH